MTIKERFKNAWDVFTDKKDYGYVGSGSSYGYRLGRISTENARSILASVYNHIAVSCSMVDILHVKLDDSENYESTIYDELNYVLTISANIDQTGRQLIRDAVESMLDEGAVAIVPVLTIGDPTQGESFKVKSARVGRIIEWYPKHILVELYNEDTGLIEQVQVEKRTTVILDNPFYTIMNEPNSVAKRLIRSLNRIDRLNDEAHSSRLDMVIQLPYAARSDIKRNQAETRLNTIQKQLTDQTYGIAYIDATEKIIQLNRPIDNTLWDQSKDLFSQLLNQLGFTEAIFNGTADETAILNYMNNTIEPILSVLVEEIKRKWLSVTAISQGQSVIYLRKPFKLVPVSQLAEIADKFTRNEIMSTNEVRGVIGLKPSEDPKADELRNANLNHPDEKIEAEMRLKGENKKVEQKEPEVKEEKLIEKDEEKEKRLVKS